jgi:HPt (histidine-containing phosphotransfer) domain-containing protein
MAFMNDTSLINTEELLEIMDDDKELIKECFNEFINDAPGMLEKIKSAIESGDAAGLDSSAHKIKGSLRYLAAGKASELAYGLEKMGKNGNLDNAGETFENLLSECEKLKNFMEGYEA